MDSSIHIVLDVNSQSLLRSSRMLGVDFQTENCSLLPNAWPYSSSRRLCSHSIGACLVLHLVFSSATVLSFTAWMGGQVGPQLQLAANSSLALGSLWYWQPSESPDKWVGAVLLSAVSAVSKTQRGQLSAQRCNSFLMVGGGRVNPCSYRRDVLSNRVATYPMWLLM